MTHTGTRADAFLAFFHDNIFRPIQTMKTIISSSHTQNISRRDVLLQDCIAKVQLSLKQMTIMYSDVVTKQHRFLVFKLSKQMFHLYSFLSNSTLTYSELGRKSIYVHRNTWIELKNLFDDIAIFIYGKRPKTHLNQIPTFVFHKFIQGITCFSNEIPQEPSKREYPLYHREASCGTSKLASNAKFKVNPNNSDEVKHNIYKRLKKCMFERLIYDQVYEHLKEQQDVGHHHELTNIERRSDNVGFSLGKSFYNVLVKFSEADHFTPVSVYVKKYRIQTNGIVIHHYTKKYLKSVIHQPNQLTIPENDQCTQLARILSLNSVANRKHEKRVLSARQQCTDEVLSSIQWVQYDEQVTCVKKDYITGTTFRKIQSFNTKTKWNPDAAHPNNIQNMNSVNWDKVHRRRQRNIHDMTDKLGEYHLTLEKFDSA